MHLKRSVKNQALRNTCKSKQLVHQFRQYLYPSYTLNDYYAFLLNNSRQIVRPELFNERFSAYGRVG
jgi:hypothetical protein